MEKKRHETSFLGSLFGQSQGELWRQLAEKVGGTFTDGGFFGCDKIVATTDQWIITLDTFTSTDGHATSTTYTRMRAPYINRDGFRFTIHRAGLFTALGEMLGMHDIQIGDAAFDRAFVIKSNDEAKVRSLLSNQTIRSLLEAQPDVWMQVRDDEGWFGERFPEGVDELYFIRTGKVNSILRLKGLFDLFSEILHQLCRVPGSLRPR